MEKREFQPFVEVNWIHNTETFGVKMGDKGYSDTQGMLGIKYSW
ncbi:TPA: hypothetical protein ACHFX9_000948 [Citrobacter farmeri]|nr:hypothetical protein [Citrobacter farmeri]MEC3929902.1 hypothetical protein [Citrobacter farmeri]